MESSFKNGREASLEVLDKLVTQQEVENDFEDPADHVAPEVLPWWSKYAKPEVTRQRLLNGKSHHPNIPGKQRKWPNQPKEPRKSNFVEADLKLRAAYKAQE